MEPRLKGALWAPSVLGDDYFTQIRDIFWEQLPYVCNSWQTQLIILLTIAMRIVRVQYKLFKHYLDQSVL